MSRPKSILLVHPPTDREYSTIGTGYIATPPPLGLVKLAELAQAKHPDILIRILDGNSVSLQGIHDVISAQEFDLIGLTDWFTNHESCLEIAEHSRECAKNGCKLVLGGPNAGHLATQILSNHSSIDAVVAGDGEAAFVALSDGIEFSAIPNLSYRGNAGVVRPSPSFVELHSAPLLRYDHPDVQASLRPYDSRLADYEPEHLAPFTLSSIRGCIKAAKVGRCSYCSVPGERVRMVDPSRFWQQIETLMRKHGIEYFFETGDEFCVGEYPRRLLGAKPAAINPRLRIYTQPVNIVPDMLETLRRLGVVEAFVGIEHASSYVLGKANKLYDPSTVVERVDLMLKYGIKPLLAFLLGLPGEDKESARRTLNLAVELVQKHRNNIQRLLLTIAVPTVGCTWFKGLAEDKEVCRNYLLETRRELPSDDRIDYEVLTKLSVCRWCQVDWETLAAMVSQAQQACAEYLDPRKIFSFGMPRICYVGDTSTSNESGC